MPMQKAKESLSKESNEMIDSILADYEAYDNQCGQADPPHLCCVEYR